MSARLRRAVLLVPTLSRADAVSNDVLGMHDALRGAGVDVEIRAGANVNVDGVPVIAPRAGSTRSLRGTDTLLIYHHSTGWDEGVALYEAATCPRVVKYHNVTPPRYFATYSEEHYEACRQGREQLAHLARLPASRWLGDSAFNTREMVDLGSDPDRSKPLPPFHDIEEHDAIQADVAELRRLRDGCFNVLFVGRFAPNKGHLHLVNVLALLNRIFPGPVRLCLVGSHDPRLALYRDELEAAIGRAGVGEQVLIAENVSDASLRSFYLAANAFLCMSEHEGFCVPVVESLHLGLPVVAYGASAVGEALGEAGLGWDSLDARLYAESLRTLAERPEIVSQLAQRGRARYESRYADEAVRASFLQTVEEVLQEAA